MSRPLSCKRNVPFRPPQIQLQIVPSAGDRWQLVTFASDLKNAIFVFFVHFCHQNKRHSCSEMNFRHISIPSTQQFQPGAHQIAQDEDIVSGGNFLGKAHNCGIHKARFFVINNYGRHYTQSHDDENVGLPPFGWGAGSCVDKLQQSRPRRHFWKKNTSSVSEK